MTGGPIAVTGASGYVGGRLVQHLRATGHAVRASSRRPSPALEATGATVVVADVATEAGALAALEGASAVVHLAGANEVDAAREPTATTAEFLAAARFVGTAALAGGVERLVLASTIHVYGATARPGHDCSETDRCEPRHPYAVARLAGEHTLATVLDGTGTTFTALRYANTVGANASVEVDRWTLLVNDLARSAVLEGRMALRTDGLQHRDFVSLADVCAVTEAAATGALAPGTYNVGSGVPRTVREVAALVGDAVERRTGRRPELVAPEPTGAPAAPAGIAVAALAAAGWTCRTPLEEAVDETVRWCIEHRDHLAAHG